MKACRVFMDIHKKFALEGKRARLAIRTRIVKGPTKHFAPNTVIINIEPIDRSDHGVVMAV